MRPSFQSEPGTLAVTPQNNEAFLREVDEELRRDQAASLWKRWGRLAIAAVVVALLSLAGWLWWTNHRAAAAGIEGETLSVALADLSEGKPNAAETRLKTLTKSGNSGYRAAALLGLADIKLGRDDAKGAAADYAAIANDASFAQPYRDLALIREITASYDSLPPASVIARLKPLAVPGNPWFGSAGEMTANAYMRTNQPKAAGAMLAAMAKDETVPESIRSRSVQLASVLGVDVVPAGKARN